jgi:uncharacterized protein YndB with AHSA1/START domain
MRLSSEDEVRREIEIDATPEEVWEAVATEEGRERWLQDDREILVEHAEEPSRLVWWWGGDSAPATRVEVLIVARPRTPGTRVVVIESRPAFPLAALAGAFSLVCA